MFNFFKKYISIIGTILFLSEIGLIFFTGFSVDFLYGFIIGILISVLIFFVDYKIFNKNSVNERSVGVLFFCLTLSLIFFVKALTSRDSGFAALSSFSAEVFVTEFILIRIFDARLN